MSDQALHWHIEEACSNAWPPLKQAIIDNWQLRFSEGLTRRVNSANPLNAGACNPQQIIKACEEIYQQQGFPALFRLPSIVDPEFEKRLNTHGYKAEGVSNVLFSTLADFKTAHNGNDIELTAVPSSEWLTAICTFKKLNDKDKTTYKNIISGITVPAVFLALRYEGHIVSMAFGAISRGLLCVESVFTDANHRGRFFAKYVLSAMVEWAAQNGANSVCLQVEADNPPVLSLYRNLGLKEVYRYHYLRKAL